MGDIALKLTERIVHGKKVKELRKQGLVPSVVYGGNAEPISTQSLLPETMKVVKHAGKHSPVKLQIGNKKRLAIIKDFDINPVGHVLRHVSFHAIKEDEVISTEVPIVLIGLGENEAERNGFVILQAIDKVEIKALPSNLPEALEVSVKDLKSDEDKVALKDIELPDGVEFASNEQDIDLIIANVYEPSALQASNEASGGTAEDESEVLNAEGAEDKKEGDELENKPEDSKAEKK